MQLRLSPVIRLAGCALSLLAVSYSIYHLLEIKKRSEEKVIHCLSAFESRVNNSRLQAKVTLYLYREKGSVQISGHYSSPAGVQTPVKSVSGIVYQVTGEDYHIRFTGNKTSFNGDDISEAFSHLIPFSVTSENVYYVYQFRQQYDGSYLIRQNGIPLLLCKNIPRR
ncbi:hypothetical protein [Klebsiella oxytoca]|uniref:hypothetical protein n=1 Tax=Klebsiella oxytoca TaxID=571 RepID=UPI00224705ED|nr:hypothetical protein [Klebsiella oxytoca]MCW9547305.1 hypothetical protein [Klebsiella oxytoca]